MLMNLSGSLKKEGEMVYFGGLCLIIALPHKQIFPPHSCVHEASLTLGALVKCLFV